MGARFGIVYYIFMWYSYSRHSNI